MHSNVDDSTPTETAERSSGDTISLVGTKTLPLTERKRRDELLLRCVSLRMTVPQIANYSRSWPFPFYDVSAVWRRIKALKLGGRIKRAAVQSLHDERVLTAAVKIWSDARKLGLTVENEQKEASVAPGIRTDMRFNILGQS